MSSGGHNVKPTAVKKALGTYRKDRDFARLENHVSPMGDVPTPPEGLDERHCKKWSSVCEKLRDAQILTSLDMDFILLYVQTWVIAEDSYRDLEANGMTLWIKTREGKKPIQNPAYKSYMDASRTLQNMVQHFGFTPRSRQQIKMQAPATEKEDILNSLIFGIN